MNSIRKTLLTIAYLLLPLTVAWSNTPPKAQQVSTKGRTIIIASDWDKAPYEFRNDKAEPAGFYVDVLTTILDEMEVPYEFKMMEAGKAKELFAKGEADLIFDNVRKYRSKEFAYTSNIISYYRISVATAKDSASIISLQTLDNPNEAVFYHGGYAAHFFKHEIPGHQAINYQPPKEALAGIVKGRYKYFVWNEAALMWKIRELNLEDEITLHEVNIPVGEIHIIGRDAELIEAIDDNFSRLKQSGELERIYDRWFHPENTHDDTSPIAIFITVGILVLALIIYLFVQLAKAHVKRIMHNSADVNHVMGRALQMGNFHVLKYDIAANRITNSYSNLMPEEGMTFQEFTARIHPKEQEAFRLRTGRLLSGRDRKFELVKRWNAGTAEHPQWHRFQGHAIVELDKNGHPQYVINAINDITPNVEEEKANYDTRTRANTLFNSTDVAMTIYDRDGWLIHINDAMKQLCEFSNSDNERYWTSLNMHDIPLFSEAYPRGSTHDLQVCQLMDYPEMGLKKYLEIHIYPIFDGNGEISQYLCTAKDLEKKHAIYADIAAQEHKLKATQEEIEVYEQRLHHLLKESHIYIFDIDLATRTMSFSHSLSHTDYTMTIDEYLEMVDDEEKEEAARQFTNYDNLAVLMRHFKRTLASPDPQWVCYVGRKRYDAEGNHTGFAGIVIEMTDLMETQKRLRETAEIANDSINLKSLFLASMTHELRTPLNAIVGFATVLKATDAPEERKELIDIINSSCDMLQRLINDILEASSITRNLPATIKPTDIDFVHEFGNIGHMLEQRVKQAGLEFIVETPYENFYTTIDIGRVQQIVTNFVTNAVKFTQQGHIRLGYRYEGHGLYIFCEDTGVGIPKDKQEVIFERFTKLDEFVQGTGMGLTICRALTDRMDGKIGVKSDGLGHGSTFWVWFPCERRLTSGTEEEQLVNSSNNQLDS